MFVLAGLFFGLAIHFKIYPVIYSFSFYLALSDLSGWRSLFQAGIAFRFLTEKPLSTVKKTL